MTTLLLSSRSTDDNQALWRAATVTGWAVVRARGIRVPEIDDDEIVIYVESLFAPTIAAALNRQLLEVPEDWLVHVPEEFRKRSISISTLKSARLLSTPSFVKPPNDKSFAAQVYVTGEDLPAEFSDDTTVLLSEPVKWKIEYRCFCLNGEVKTVSPYLRDGVLAKLHDYHATAAELSDATSFANKVLVSMSKRTPNAIVIDVGQIVDRGWAVVEANAAWGSGIYGCDPDSVLEVIRHASIASK